MYTYLTCLLFDCERETCFLLQITALQTELQIQNEALEVHLHICVYNYRGSQRKLLKDIVDHFICHEIMPKKVATQPGSVGSGQS